MGRPPLDSAETNFEVRCFDSPLTPEEFAKLPRNGLYIILDNLRSAFNVGAIFRLCDCLRVKGLFLCGCTAFPPHVKLDKTSLGTIDYVPWKYFKHTAEAVTFLKEQNIPVWAAETTSGCSVMYDAAHYPAELGIVFGNEALGVHKNVLSMCDALVEIPVYGFKNSLNVAASCAVIGYRVIAEQGKSKIN